VTDSIMSGGKGGKDDAGGGGGIYGFMMTDTLATSLSKGGGLGLASMLEKQFAPRASSTALTTSAALKLNPLSNPSP
jgi:Rod binding domain-containing protein